MSEKKNISSIFHNSYTAWIILLLSVALTVVAWFISLAFTKQLSTDRFKSVSTEIVLSIEDRMDMYEQSLWGGVALFNASDEVTRDDWHEYVSTLDIQSRLPGIQGLGFAIPFVSQKKDSIVNLVRAEGFEEFEITPVGERSQYSSIIYIEPFDWRNKRAFGFDMWSNEMRREAMQRAIDEKQAATSGVITLVQETEDAPQKGFLTYLPVFENKDSLNIGEKHKGWVYAAFRAGDLMNGILGESKGVDIKLYDGKIQSSESLLFQSKTEVNQSEVEQSELEKTIELNIQGRDWTLCLNSNDDFFSSRDELLPRIVVVGGVIIDLLLFFVILSISKNQKRAEKIAQNMTVDLKDKSTSLEKMNLELKESEAEMLVLMDLMSTQNERLTNFSYIVSHNLRSHMSNITMMRDIIKEDKPELFEDKNFQMLTKAVGNLRQTISHLNEVAAVNLTQEKTIIKIKLLEFVSRTLESVNADLVESNADVKIKVDDDLRIDGIPAYVESILINLITNAIKYRSFDRPLELKIEAKKSGKWVEMSISDNGLGIDLKRNGDKVFGMYKVFHEHKDSRGIGLFITKNQVEAIGGRISVESEPDVGSKFILRFKDEVLP